MVITVNLNPNIDRLIKVDGFIYGGMNRILEKKDDVAGKGLNACIVMKRLGVDVLLMGFMYEQNGSMAVEKLEMEGVLHDFVWQPGSMRLNTKLLDIKTSVITEINDRGVPATEEAIRALKEKLLSRAKKGDYIAVNGSMAPGCPPSLFAEIIAEANKKGIRCALDAEGESLIKGTAARPYLVKVNRFEFETLTGKAMKTDDDIVTECRRLVDTGVGMVAVSLGAEGAVISDGKNAYRAEALRIQPRSATGAGDSMLAGILAGLIQNRPPEDLLRMGTAAATATVLCEGTELATRELYESLLKKVVTAKL
jgi:1-phosphofructokinase